MIDIFLNKLPGFLYEPIAIGGLLGILAFLACSWKKRELAGLFLACTFVFMVGWRIAAQIISSRYVAVFVYLAVIFTAWLLFKIGEWLALVPRIPVWCRRLLPWLLTAGFMIACAAKVFHINPYEDYVRYVCAAAAEDAQNFKNPVLIGQHDEIMRYSYYSEIPSYAYGDRTIQDVNASIVRQHIDKSSADVIYFLRSERTKNGPLKHTDLAVPAESWTLLSSRYENRKKRKVLRVYRYLPIRNKTE